MTDDLVRKIAALLATAESLQEAGNDEAAASYIAKAHELQSKYSIDQAMLDARTGAKPAADAIVKRTIKLTGTHGRRRVHLAHYVAKASDCTGYFESGTSFSDGAYRYVVFGHAGDVDWVETLCTSLNLQVDVALAAAVRTKPSWENGRSFAVAFVEGFARTINRRLSEAKRQASRDAQQAERDRQAAAYATDGEAAFQAAGANSVSLVLADKVKRVEAEMTAQVGPLGKGRTTSTTSTGGYRAGQAAGESASLARGSLSGSRGSLGR